MEISIKENTKYSAEHIKTLKGIEAIRLRPGMYCASVTIDGVHHITLEIISNAIDEYLSGQCNKIDLSLYKDNSISITDNGRGVPFGKASDGTETLENIFTKLHTGAKFNSDGSTGYNSSGGLNGVGSKATNALSEFFQVVSIRDGKQATMKFAKGKRQDYTVIPINTKETGTTITFKPDIEIFKEGISLDKNRLKKQLKELSFLCKGLLITLYDEESNTNYEFKSENGIIDYVEDLAPVGKRITSVFSASTNEGRFGVEIGCAYTSTYSETIKLYTNNIPNSGGTHLTGFRTAVTRTLNDVARANKILKDKDDNLTGEDLKEGLVLVLSLKMPDPVFDGQTKDTLTSSEGRTVVERLVSKEIRNWFESNPNDLKAIVNKAILSKKAREAARKAREVTRGKNASNGFSSLLPGKLSDCLEKSPKGTEIFLVEGISAGGSAKQARDRKTQAILTLKGKVINTIKNDMTKILANNEIRDMILAFGCGIGKDFDISKLRYERVVILTDADVDGNLNCLLYPYLFIARV